GGGDGGALIHHAHVVSHLLPGERFVHDDRERHVGLPFGTLREVVGLPSHRVVGRSRHLPTDDAVHNGHGQVDVLLLGLGALWLVLVVVLLRRDRHRADGKRENRDERQNPTNLHRTSLIQ